MGKTTTAARPRVHAPIEGSINSATFTLGGKEGYLRVICRDEKGLDATTNAYFMDERWGK